MSQVHGDTFTVFPGTLAANVIRSITLGMPLVWNLNVSDYNLTCCTAMWSQTADVNISPINDLPILECNVHEMPQEVQMNYICFLIDKVRMRLHILEQHFLLCIFSCFPGVTR